MIVGDFLDHGRPFVKCLVIVPSVGPRRGQPQVSSEVLFLVDTGPDATVLSQRDCETRLGLLLTGLPAGSRSMGVGGITDMRQLRAILEITHDDGTLPVFSHDLLVAEAPFSTSILGRDIMSFGELVMNFPAGVLTLDLPAVAA